MKGQTAQLRKRLLTPVLGGRDRAFRWIFIGLFICGMSYVLLRGVFDQPKKPDNFTNSHSASPGGHLALTRLLQDLGFRVERRVRPLNSLGPEYYAPGGSCLVVLEPVPDLVYDNPREFNGLFSQSWRRPNVLAAMPRRGYQRVPSPGARGVVEVAEYEHSLADVNIVLHAFGLGEGLRVVRTERPALFSTAAGEHVTRLHDEPAQVFLFDDPRAAARFEVLIETEEGEPVALRPIRVEGYQNAILLSDPDLLSNRFLGETNAAALMTHLFRGTGCRAFDLDESMHGLATQASIEYLAATPPGLWFTLALFLALFLFGWRESTVLRPAVADTETRRSRGVVIEGVARMMERARDYAAASTALLRRARTHLEAGPVQVHASGMAGSTPATLARDKKERLENLRVVEGEEAHSLVRCAQTVAELRKGKHGGAS